jgi:hypothetical protein
MQKTIEVEVDKNTWPLKGAGSPPFPSSFVHGVGSHRLDVLSALLVIGQLTTPPMGSGATLSEFWAWVRYANAIADTTDLRITKPFADLDMHQKTILSDDFGMGIPVAWLIPVLGLVGWCDGRYFRERMSALLMTPPPPPAKKRGPDKSPDFVFEDANGQLHIVECKGTQGSPKDREKQFAGLNKHGRPTGGRVQKKAFAIKPGRAGQRLVCGLVLDHQHGRRQSSIKVVDPEFQEVPPPEDADPDLWHDPVVRATLAKALRGAGLLASASVLAAPSGPVATSRRHPERLSRRPEARRISTVEQRRAAARAELAAALDRQRIRVGEDDLVGREFSFAFPVPLVAGGTEYRSVSVRQGVRPDFLEELMEDGFVDAPVSEGPSWLRERARGIKPRDEDSRGVLSIGQVFQAEIVLDRDAESRDRPPPVRTEAR